MVVMSRLSQVVAAVLSSSLSKAGLALSSTEARSNFSEFVQFTFAVALEEVTKEAVNKCGGDSCVPCSLEVVVELVKWVVEQVEGEEEKEEWEEHQGGGGGGGRAAGATLRATLR